MDPRLQEMTQAELNAYIDSLMTKHGSGQILTDVSDSLDAGVEFVSNLAKEHVANIEDFNVGDPLKSKEDAFSRTTAPSYILVFIPGIIYNFYYYLLLEGVT